jgi:hypothetical protein
MESGVPAGFDGHKSRNSSKVLVVPNTLGRLLVIKLPQTNDDKSALVGEPARRHHAITRQSVALA